MSHNDNPKDNPDNPLMGLFQPDDDDEAFLDRLHDQLDQERQEESIEASIRNKIQKKESATNGLAWRTITPSGRSVAIVSYTGGMGDIIIPRIIEGSYDEPLLVTTIEENCFKNSTINSISLPSSIIRIKEKAFQGCRHLRHITIPSECKSIGNYAFNNTGLRSVNFPPGLKKIGKASFRTCHHLTDVVFPHGITQIGEQAFSHCKNLSSVTFCWDREGICLCHIKSRAFECCPKIEEVVIQRGMEVDHNVFDAGIHITDAGIHINA